MDDELMALAQRAVACKAWRWMPGMRSMHMGWRFVGVDGGRVLWVNRFCRRMYPTGTLMPDLTDPATRGCLLALVREAWGQYGDGVTVSLTRKGADFEVWSVLGVYPSSFRGGDYQSEPAALVAALEAAP